MGCNCRHGSSAVSRRAPRRAARPAPSPAKNDSVCSLLEMQGNSIPLRLGPEFRSLYLLLPMASSLPVGSFISGSGCHGPFTAALLAADLKLQEISASPTRFESFRAVVTSPHVTLGYLREVFRSL